jgi:DNA polymerase epsilon subunit 4
MRFPLAKIKNIMKLDEDINLCQKNAYFVMGRLTELFLQELARNALSVTKINKRKTMNLEDLGNHN